ncbi:MAG: glycosyl hydrolase, partial [Gemmatimonadota bacterium]|nr:glycosyl hydrolase [Gemmatimonadota bacterium]
MSRTTTRPMFDHLTRTTLAALIPAAALAALAATPQGATAQAAQPDIALITQATRGLALRQIGPALMGGRIADIAVHPDDPATWYIAVGSGGVWKTTNSGITWTPVFDDQPSYSIGAVAIDPSDPDVVWVGTGEN